MAELFHHDGFDLAYSDEGAGEPVLLIHGFASSAKVNWISTGWAGFLREGGFRVIALDNRGHGQSSKSYDEADYAPGLMAGDAMALMTRLGVAEFHVIGYSMGARIAAFLAIANPDAVKSLTLGGLGMGLVEGVGGWDPIKSALLSETPETITDPRGRAFRKFADQTKSDRRALAACIARSRELPPLEKLASLKTPVLIAVGTKDDIAGSPHGLAALMPRAQAFDIKDRDHMMAVGDRTFKARALAFLQAH